MDWDCDLRLFRWPHVAHLMLRRVPRACADAADRQHLDDTMLAVVVTSCAVLASVATLLPPAPCHHHAPHLQKGPLVPHPRVAAPVSARPPRPSVRPSGTAGTLTDDVRFAAVPRVWEMSRRASAWRGWRVRRVL